MKDEEKMVHGGGGSGGTAGSGGDDLFSIGACDVGISGKSHRSLHPPLRGDIAHTGMGVAGAGGVLAGSRVESEFDVTKFGSPHQPQKGNVSKEVNLSFI